MKEASPGSNRDIIVVEGKEYPAWAVNKAKRLLAKAGHNDLERMIQSVLIVRERLENAVPADSDEKDQVIPGGVVILPHSFSSENR